MSQSPHVILARDAHVGINKKKILFILWSSKTHDQGNKPQKVKISSIPLNMKKQKKNESISDTLKYCLFSILNRYISARPPAKSEDEQFLVYSDNSLITPAHIYKNFKTVINLIGLDSINYSFHPLRAGRTQDLRALGFSVETIKDIGHWKSNAVFTYLKN